MRIWLRRAIVALGLFGLSAGVWFAWPTLRTLADPLAAARVAYERGDDERAAELARDVLLKDRDDLEALRLLARASARSGELSSARNLYQRIGFDRMEAEDYYLLGEGLLDVGLEGPALGAFEQAEQIDPDHAGTRLALWKLEWDGRRLEQARDHARRLETLEGWEAVGAALKGRTLLDLLDPQGAAKAFRTAFTRDRELSRSPIEVATLRKQWARALIQSNRLAEAREVLDRFDAPDSEALWLASRVELLDGELETAATRLGDARRLGWDGDPMVEEPAAYVGSDACKKCHASILRSQRDSHHAKTFDREPGMRPLPIEASEIVDPRVPSIRHRMTDGPDGVVLETKTDAGTYRAVVRFVMGSGDRGLTPVGVQPDGTFRELRLSHYPVGWDLTTGQEPEPESPDLFLGRELSESARRRCLSCHTTNFRHSGTGTGPTLVDRGIGCEACHGPGGNHLAAIEAGFPELAIQRPKAVQGAAIVELCGRCHQPPGDKPVGPPDDPATVRFQAATLVRSACYTRSGQGLDCVTCHNPHHDAVEDASFYEATCLACHDASAQPQDRDHATAMSRLAFIEPEDRVPCPTNPATGCIDCHMPPVAGAMLHTEFTDHHIRVRDHSPNGVAAAPQ